MAERDNFLISGDVHCPRCWRLNPATASVCEDCGASLIPAPEPVVIKAKKAERNRSWLKGYAVACWLIMVLAVVVGLVVGIVNFFTPGQQGVGLLLIVCGLALAAIHLIVGKGLWLMESWAESTALQMHGLVLIYLILQVIVSVVDPNIPYLGTVLSTPVLLALIGGLALWVGARAEEGERLAINGPDPDSVAEITSAPVKIVNAQQIDTGPYPHRAHVPPTTEPPIVSVYRVNPQRNDHYQPDDEDDNKPDKLTMTAMALGANVLMNFLERRKDASQEAPADESDAQASRRRSKPPRAARHKEASKRGSKMSGLFKFFK